jgi:phosphoribosyl 1,2-cyclic phosphodiesterase
MENGAAAVFGSAEADEEAEERRGSELIVLGSGSSTGVPSPLCLINPQDPPCYVCHSAVQGPPELNHNYRCNPSLVISFKHDDGQQRYIQIDAGKDFKEQVLRWFVPYKIPRLDALILTHEHADAILGLDNIRGVQPYSANNEIPPMPVYLSQHTMNRYVRSCANSPKSICPQCKQLC